MVKFIVNIVLPNYLLFNKKINCVFNSTLILCIAFAIPLIFMLLEKWLINQVSFISKVALVNIGLNFLFFIIPFSVLIFASKEALFPIIIFIIHLFNQNTKSDFLTPILNSLNGNHKNEEFQKTKKYSISYKSITYLFLFTSIVNFINPFFWLKSEFGTSEFNAELAQLNFYNLILIYTPTIIILIGIIYIIRIKNVA